MAGLSNLIANTTEKATTLPSWMDQAQQNVVNQATAGATQVPQLQNTVAGQAINTYGGASNPFAQAQNTLGSIASGAANPWITNPTTGQVTPNTNTALGGLFQAQNQQLQQLAPNITAVPTAAGTASGQYGSLRTQTAADKALADAQADLFAKQMTAALQNQQTGVQAGTGMGNIGAQEITGANTLTGLQQTAPLSSSANLAKILASLNVPATEKQTVTVSPLNQIGALTSALGGGTNAVNSLLNTINPGTTIASLLSGLFSNQPGVGEMLDSNGNVVKDPTYGNTDLSSVIQNGIPEGVTLDENGMGSNGIDYSYLMTGP